MKRFFRHFFLFWSAMLASLAIYHFSAGIEGLGSGLVRSAPARTMTESILGSGYHLADLKLLDRTCYFVSEKYVEPMKIDPAAMYDSALDAVERMVDSVLLQRVPEGHLLHVSVGAYSTTVVVDSLDDLDDLRRELGKVAVILDEHLDDPEVDRREIEYSLINGMLATLDPHSVLLPPEMSKEMDVENQGEFGGLGITITIRDGRLTIEYPLEDTPAYRAGLKADDVIERIEDESTINMTLDEAVSKLRGPPGEPVTIMVMRDMFDKARSFTIVRDVIRINPVEGDLLEGGIGYVRIKSFHANTSRDLDAVLASFRRDLGGPLHGLILDLRGDPGGFLNQAVEVSNRFLGSGTVVSTVEADGTRETERATQARTEPEYPLVVLTNANSASASEIVAGALRNRDRAIILGERTFGKGSVQHLYNNADDSKLKLTVAQYLTPGDKSIQSVGIPPDVRLVPLVVQKRVEPDQESERKSVSGEDPWISLLWRERVTREADLDHHLDRNEDSDEKPAFVLSYLRDIDEDDSRTDKRDLSRDWEVGFAREVLLNSNGASRVELLEAAAPVVQRRKAEEERRVIEAFQKLGIDWAPGDQPVEPRLALDMDLGKDQLLVAGQEERITFSLTNHGSTTVYQAFAITSSDNEWLDESELFFGRVEPGETRSFQKRIKLADGYPSEIDKVEFTVRDPRGTILAEDTKYVETRGFDLPRYAYGLRVVDDGSGTSKGNDDGLLQVGEVVDLELVVTNIGNSDGGEAFAKVRNESGHDLDLNIGTLDLGSPAPWQSVDGRFSFEVRGSGEDGFVELELQVGDNSRFDYGAIMRGGFYDYLAEREHLRLPVFTGESGKADIPDEASLRLDALRTPPLIELTRRPDKRSSESDVVLSGVVRDDSGVRDVIVYRGNDKIYYQGGEGDIVSLPFSVESTLDGGLNTFIILAHDKNGLTAVKSVSVYSDSANFEPPGLSLH